MLFPGWKVSRASVRVKCDSPLVLVPGGLFEVVGSELSPAYVSEILGSLSVQCSDGCEVLRGCGSVIACLMQYLCHNELVVGGVLCKTDEEQIHEARPVRPQLLSSLRIQVTA